MKLAWFSPMPPERSGIADYSALVLSELRSRIEVEVVRRRAKRPPRGVDLSVYHVGNNPDAHGWIVDALQRSPGVVVLHDFVLHHLISGTTLARGDVNAYLDALERDGGLVARLLGYAVIEKRIAPLWESRAVDYPLAREVLRFATAVVAHSAYVLDRVRETGYAGPTFHVPHAAWPTPPGLRASADGAEDEAGDGPVIAAFGHLNASKRVPQLLEAFAAVREAHPEARLLLVGAQSPGFDVGRRLQRLGLAGDGVELTGYVEEQELWRLMADADVHVNLRAPTMGETSGTALRALSLGKPLVVSDLGWFAELPDEVALKVPVDAREVETLAAALELLVARPDVRAQMGAAAQALARGAHALPNVADAYVAAFEQAAGGPAVADGVLREVSTAAAEVGIEPGSADAHDLAAALREVDLGR